MKTISYCTALYHKQGYCQKERIEGFNEAAERALEHGIRFHSQLYINNSDKKFAKEMKRLYRRKARFPHIVRDLGKLDYWTNYRKGDIEWRTVDEHGRQKPTESWKEFQFVELKHYDIYHLLAHIFNIGIDYSLAQGHEYYAILSGDQLLPPEHPQRMVEFLEAHEKAGLVSSLAFYDFSKKEIADEKGKRTFLTPLIIFRQRPGETLEQMEDRRRWVYENLLPYPENGNTGLEYCEVDAVGTGGAVIPRKVFGRLKFEERVFEGEGEDIQYCLDIKSKLGLNVYIVPTVVMQNRYADGQRY